MLPELAETTGLRGATATQATTLPLGETAPDAETLVVLQGVLEALAFYLAGGADLLSVAGGAALFGKERLRVGLRAQRVGLPGESIIEVL
jgi:hypothetical protein